MQFAETEMAKTRLKPGPPPGTHHAGTFKKGQPSANPGGRPKGPGLTAILRQRLAEPADRNTPVPGGATKAHKLVDALIKAASKESAAHLSMAFDRTEGKVPSTLVLEGGDKPVSLVVLRGASADDL